jgi:hypothetical protein
MATLMNSDVALFGAELWVWMEAHPLMVLVISLALSAPGVICILAARRGAAAARAGLNRIDERLSQIYRAVELLTDTTESAFGTTFAEIERISEETGTRAARRAAMPNRVAAAASEGLSPREIALREGVSEGEIRLRLQLIEATGAAGESAGMTASEASADQPEQSYQTH